MLLKSQEGISFVEIMISVVILGVTLICFTFIFSGARSGFDTMGDQRASLLLAEQMMEEIMSQDYEDKSLPDDETGPRTNFDDVDDYHDWRESPPQYMDGRLMNGKRGTPDYTKIGRAHV